MKSPQDTLPFHPYYTVKDSVGLCVFFIVFAVLVFFAPNFLGDVNNFIPANPLQTPADIVPEWYFLPYYAILRSVPNKLLGVCMMFGSILVLFVLPWLDTSRVRSARFRPIYRQFIWVWVLSFVVLGVCGAHKPEGIWVVLSRVATLYYFLHFLVILPILGKLERPLPLPESISRPGHRWRRPDALGRHRQADGEGMMRVLRHLMAAALLSPAGGACPGAQEAPDAAGAALELRRPVRQLRPRRRPARLPGLFRGLLGLPLAAIPALPRPRGHRPDRRADQGDRRRGHRAAGARRPGRAEGRAGDAGRSVRIALSRTRRRPGRRITAPCRRTCR